MVLALATCLALAVWVWVTVARTRLRELEPWKRFLLLLVFAAGATEAYGLAALCDWRDLAFLVLGV